MSSRGWAIALGVGAIVLAAILLVVYLDRYRARVGGANTPSPLPRREVELGAIEDPQSLAGRAASVTVYPGAQLTDAQFSATSDASIDSQISKTERALSIAIDNVHGSLSQVQAGDFVDIYSAANGKVCLFQPNVKVLAIPTTPGPSGEGNLVLRVDTKDAAAFAFAADNTQLWFVLRPVAGARPTAPGCADLNAVTRGR
jgi:Flp pilus assembly protein CpaB